MQHFTDIEYRHRLKAARTLLRLTQKDVANEAGVSIVTMRRIESETGYADKVAENMIQKIKVILEQHGAVFLQAGDISPGPGIALRGTAGR